MRTTLTISVIAHALLWGLIALPRQEPLAKPAENPIVVDIVSPDETRVSPDEIREAAAEVPAPANTPEASTNRMPEPRPSPPPQRQNQQRPQVPRSEAERAPSASARQVASAESKSEQSLTGSSWLDTALISRPVTASAFDAAQPAANLSQGEIAAFKAHLQECWDPPAGLATARQLVVVLRVSLTPNGTLMAEPTMVAASASPDGPALMQTALRALRQCQPYGFLPVTKYEEWKVLDLSFSPTGLSARPVF